MDVSGQFHTPAVFPADLSYSLATYYHTKFQNPALSVASGAPISELCTDVVSVLLMVGNYILQRCVKSSV